MASKESLEQICWQDSLMRWNVIMRVTSRHLCHILLAKSKSHIPCALKKRGVNARRWGVMGGISACSVKEGRILFSFLHPDTVLLHTSQEAFVPSGVEKKVQLEETV